jgi:OOP family OmpA-OmpF porin
MNRPASRLEATEDEGGQSSKEWQRLRSLLLGSEQASLRALDSKVGNRDSLVGTVADVLSEAAAERARRDDSITQVLAPIVNEGLQQSVRRNPQPLVDALYPIMGPAIRRSISEALAEMMQAFNRAVEQSLSPRALKWRWDAWRTGQSYANVVLLHTLVYRVEQVFLIHRETGLLLSHVQADEVTARDPSMVSGMLTAIRDFVGDSFELAQHDGIETIRLGDLTVHARVGPKAILAAVVRGSAPESLAVGLAQTLERIHRSHAIVLAHFDGDAAPFENIAPDLRSCLTAQIRSASGSKWRGRAALAIAATLVGWYVVAHHQAVARWNAIVQALAQEPGLVIVDPGAGAHRIRGLRDPLARDPIVVIGADRAREEHVSWEWSPYLSLDPPMILARARLQLRPPATVSLSVAGGVLRVSGQASDRWLGDARARATTIPGLTALDYSALKVTDTDGIEQARETLDSTAVYFEPGSDTLLPAQIATLEQLLPSFRILSRTAARGRDCVVEIIGRADAPGTTEYNLRLSEARAQAVRQFLSTHDVPDALMRSRGVGVIEAGHSEGDEVERRVNFAVLTTGERASPRSP